MAAQAGGAGEPGYIREYIKRNIYLKIFILILIITSFIYGGLLLISGTDEGITFAKNYNALIFLVAYILHYIPFYSNYIDALGILNMYINHKYTLNTDFLTNIEEWIYIGKFFLMTLPLLLASLLFLKRHFDIREYFKDYYKQLEFRNLRKEKEPIKKLEKGMETEGTFVLDKKEYSEEELKAIQILYLDHQIDKGVKRKGIFEIYKIRLRENLELYYKSLKNLQSRYNNEKEWNAFFEHIINNKEQPYKYLKLFLFKDVDYELLSKSELKRLKLAFSWKLHFKYHQKKKKWVSREFFIDSLNKEVSYEEIYKWYYAVLLFYLNKKFYNFPAYIYTQNLDAPLEWKKIVKWTDNFNAPGKVEIILGEKNGRLSLMTVDLYYRLYMFRQYVGIKAEYMVPFIKMIDDQFGI